MCTGLEIAMLGLAAASTATQIHNQNQAAQASYAISQNNLEQTYAENDRLMEEVNLVAREDSSDRVRQALSELGSLRVAAGELGATGTSFQALLAEQAYAEGLDLSRIERNRDRQIKQIEASNRAGKQAYLSNTSLARQQTKAANTGAILGGISSGLQIGASHQQNQRLLELERNKVR